MRTFCRSRQTVDRCCDAKPILETLATTLPDDKHARLRQLAKHCDISVNKLVEELATISIAEFDAESRFRALAARGSAKQGLAILGKLDASLAGP